MKKALWALAVVVVLALAGLWWLRGNVDHLVATAITRYGSAMTGATVKIKSVNLDTANGRGSLQALTIGNPPGFKLPHAFKAETIELDVDLRTLADDVVVVRKVTILSPSIGYEKGQAMTNIDAIQKNIATYLGPSTAASKGKKIIVQDLQMRNAKATARAPLVGDQTATVNLPDIHLRNLGQAQGGLTPGELAQEITNAVEQKLLSTVRWESVLRATGDALNKAGNAIKGLFK
ncbi:MAG: hypothetical protein U5M53_06100 [Rhodoferax sp.]|nr:hypothetical protein [Rhodoferax sp.]